MQRIPAIQAITTGSVRRTLFILALPVLGEQMLNTLVGLFDTYLAGTVSSAATSAVGLGAYVAWLASMIVMLVGTGTTALVSRRIGEDNTDDASRIANQSVTLGGIVGVLVFALLFSLAPGLAWYAKLAGPAGDITTTYLRIDSLGYVAMSVTIVACAALRGAGDMRTPMVIYTVINTVNIIASLTLVRGLGPFPALGVTGIAIGTVFARTLGACLAIMVLWRGKAGLKLRRSELRVNIDRARRILRIGLPAAADGAVMWAGHVALLRIIAQLAGPPYGQAMFAAHIIAMRVEALTYLPAFAWGTAVATMIGQSIGANQPARAKRAGHEGVFQCGLLSSGIAILFFFGAPTIYAWMSNDEIVRAAGAGPFRLLAVFQPILAMSIVYIGGLRGAGDTRVPFWITLTGIVFVRLPMGYFFGIVCNGGLIGAWAGMCGDMIWRAATSTIRYTGGRWLTTRV